MQEEAEIEVEETFADSTAETEEQELSVPKHRLDALAAELRRAREENKVKTDALQQLMSVRVPQQPQETDEEELAELENLGLDRKQVNVLKKMFTKQIEARAREHVGQTRGMIANLANQMEETQLVSSYGESAKKMLPRIKALRMEHAQQNSYLSAENAYKLLLADDMISGRSKVQKAPVKTEAKAAAKVEAPKTQQKSDAGRSIEDWENELDEQIKGGPGRL